MPGKFVGWQKFDAVGFIDGSLGFRVKGPEGFDFVIEKINAVGQVRAHGVNVEDGPSYRILAVFIHVVGMMITGCLQLHSPAVDIQGLAHFQQQGIALQIARGGKPVHQRARRNYQNAVACAG